MQHIAFDLGNVLVEVDMRPFFKAVKDLGIHKKDIDRLINLYERSVLCGNIDLYDIFVDELGDESEAQHLIDAWCSGCRPNDRMSNFVCMLKHEGFKIAYLSNISSQHLNYLSSKFPDFMSYAAVSHMSCEVGAAKPSKLFYQSFLMQNEDFSGCTYLDDKQENLKSSTNFKFDSINFNLKKLTSEKPSVLKVELNSIKERLLRGF